LKRKGLLLKRRSSKRALPHKVGLCSIIRNSFIRKSIHDEGLLNEKDVFNKKIPPKECLLVEKASL
jgi:hypothetical protein